MSGVLALREPDFVVAKRVIGALILRDMRTRGGRPAFGMMKAVIIPYGHLIAVVVAYSILGRVAPIGTDTVTFLALGVIPFILFMYPARMVMMSLISSRPLLSFPTITTLSIIIARIVLEAMAACFVCAILIASLMALGFEFAPQDKVMLFFAFLSAVGLGIAFGVLNAAIVQVMPGWTFAFNVVISGFYASSGLMFLPDLFPERLRAALAFNPLLHCVEWVRTAYYDQYSSYSLDLSYLFWFTTGTLLLGLFLERVFRRMLLVR